MGKTAILSDSTCDLSPELIDRYGITINPLYAVLDGKQYRDGLEIDPDGIYGFVAKNGRLPKTAASSVGDHEEFFRPFLERGDEIVYFTISSQMSVNYNNAVTAADGNPKIHIIDSENLSTGVGLQVLRAAELAAEGKTADEICDEITEMRPRVDTSFIIDTVDYLYKGGRCSAIAALGANMLKLHPCIEVKNGAMGVGKKYRGKMRDVLQTYARARLSDIDSVDKHRVFITHSGCPQENIDAVYDVVSSVADFDEIAVTRAGCTVSCHCGPGTLGVLFVRK